MNAHASPSPIEFHDDALLGALLGALEPHADKPLVLEFAGRTIQPGYHVTEVKAGSFVTLDCGGNPDQWRETILQVEDLPAVDGSSFMAAGKFRAILDQVAARIPLAADARLTFEVGPPGAPMQVFDAHSLEPEADRVVLRLAPRSAVCKPRHRAAQTATVACCGPSAKSAGRCG
jgi:hypothetical protein